MGKESSPTIKKKVPLKMSEREFYIDVWFITRAAWLKRFAAAFMAPRVIHDGRHEKTNQIFIEHNCLVGEVLRECEVYLVGALGAIFRA